MCMLLNKVMRLMRLFFTGIDHLEEMMVKALSESYYTGARNYGDYHLVKHEACEDFSGETCSSTRMSYEDQAE